MTKSHKNRFHLTGKANWWYHVHGTGIPTNFTSNLVADHSTLQDWTPLNLSKLAIEILMGVLSTNRSTAQAMGTLESICPLPIW